MATPFTEPTSRTMPPQYDTRENESALALLRRLMDELATLFRQEMALATAEITGALTKLAVGIVSIATGGLVLFAGFLAMLAAAVLGLSNVMEPWLAALIVGAVVAAIGLTMVYAGRRRIDPSTLKPRRSPESLRQDKEVLTRSAS